MAPARGARRGGRANDEQKVKYNEEFKNIPQPLKDSIPMNKTMCMRTCAETRGHEESSHQHWPIPARGVPSQGKVVAAETLPIAIVDMENTRY